MGDIAVKLGTYGADMAIANDDLAADEGLETAVILSLFTDRRADDGDVLPPGETDRRGWLGDQFAEVEGDRFGSRLWLLERAPATTDTLRRAEEYDREALAWMIEDRVAAAVTVACSYEGTVLVHEIRIERPDGSAESFRFAHVWDAMVTPGTPPTVPPREELLYWDNGLGWDLGTWS